MVMTGAFYRNIEYPTLLVRVISWDDHVIVVEHIGEAGHVGEVPYPFTYFMNAYELDG